MHGVVGVYGGSFNPPTLAHAAAIAAAASDCNYLFVPVVTSHMFGKQLAPLSARIEMVNLMVRDMEKRHSIKVVSGTPSTYEQILYLHRSVPAEKYRLYLGADIAQEIPRWDRYEELLKLVELAYFQRDGFVIPSGERALSHTGPRDISSTQVRAAITEGGCYEAVKDLLHPEVYNYLQNTLYY